MLNGLLCHHLTHIGSSGWITDHCGTSTNQSNWLIATHLQTLHQTKCHKMSYMQAVCCRIKSNIERCLSFIDQTADLLFVCYLCNQTSCYKFFVQCHLSFLQNIFSFWGIKKRPYKNIRTKYTPCYHLISRLPHDNRLCKYRYQYFSLCNVCQSVCPYLTSVQGAAPRCIHVSDLPRLSSTGCFLWQLLANTTCSLPRLCYHSQ